MAKDTEKLIRELSLISYLMAARRPVSAQEIRRDVEGYAAMNEDAFARRFYADRTELEALGISLTIRRPLDGAAEQETYALRSESFHLAPIAFSDRELAALQTALKLLDGEFAYAEPLRLALQQITWGRPSPLAPDGPETVALGITASAGGPELSARLAKIEAAIFRSKTITFDYYTMERDEVATRCVDPYFLLFRNGEYYLLGHSHERAAVRVFRLSRIRGKVAYATKSEHDFRRPAEFDPREYANRAEWQFGESEGVAEIELSPRIGWYVERHFGRFGEIEPLAAAASQGATARDRKDARGRGRTRGQEEAAGRIFRTPYASSRAILSWLLGLRGHARLLGPPELLAEQERRLDLLEERHRAGPPAAGPARGRQLQKRAGDEASAEQTGRRESRRSRALSEAETTIKPERFARLITLAGIMIEAGRRGQRLALAQLAAELRLSVEELREDIAVLNVINFGGGSYVLYAEVDEERGEVEIDPEPYADNFDRPARLLPVEAKALIAAIDLIGAHVGEGALASAREKIVAALGCDPQTQGLVISPPSADDEQLAERLSRAISRQEQLELEYYKPDEDELSLRIVEPYALANGREGWYLAAFDTGRSALRHFRLDRIKRARTTGARFAKRADLDLAHVEASWLKTGEVSASREARLWISPERARWARERYTVYEERTDGSVVVGVRYASLQWLVGALLREAGDAVVLEPTSARRAVLRAIASLRAVPVPA
jgi:predicted DNA-binding transcriptional regulator YafY